MYLEGFTPFKKEDVERYIELRCWGDRTFGDILDNAAHLYPDKEALVDRKSRLTYAQFREKVDRLAIGFMSIGIEALDRVLLQLPNWNEFFYAYFALQKVGAIPVLLIARYRQYEINHLSNLTGATGWIVPETIDNVSYLPIVIDVLNNNPRIQHVILVRGKAHSGFGHLDSLIESGEITHYNMNELTKRRPDPMRVAHMGPTGGTTGLPKVAPRSHNDFLCRTEYVAKAWELNSNDICLAVAPIGHDLTFSIVACPTIFSAGKLVVLDSTDQEEICKTIEKEKVTAVGWVPSLAARLMQFDGLKDYNLSSLKKMYCGGEASPVELIQAVKDNLGCVYINAYGGTEGMSTMTGPNDDIDRVCHTVGRPTCPYDRYMIIDENGKEQPPNTPGELAVKGPGIFTGYYKSPEENKKVFNRDGFFRTGDEAMIDEAGYIILTGRFRDIIKRGGESISAAEIENLIVAHPDVAAVAVIGYPDPALGEKACAFIQPRPGKKPGFEEITSFLKSKGSSVLQLPERIEIIDSMPLTETGKIDKKALRQRE